MSEDKNKTEQHDYTEELSLEILDVVHGGRQAPYSKGQLEEMVRKIHAPDLGTPGMVIPPDVSRHKP